MQTKILIVAIIENQNGDILLRKKPAGSPPYVQTWYLFGAELVGGSAADLALVEHIQKQAGVTVSIRQRVGWDTEIKIDLDGIKKHFVYLDVICDYVSGGLVWGEGIEKLEWVPKEKLAQYDNVPPSLKVFKQLGYILG